MSEDLQVSKPSNDSTTMAVLNWVGTLVFGFIPPLILFLVKKDDAYVLDQSKEALNWSITVIIGYVIAFMLTFVVVGAILMPVLFIVHVIFCILGAVKTSKGESFRVPFALRLIK